MAETQEQTLLVTGASGHLGQRVLELLLEAGEGSIIATTRSPEALADFDEPDGLVDAFRGADRLLLISTDAVSVPGKRAEQHRAAVNAAEEAGVQHVVYTSLPNPGPESPIAVAPSHRATEEALAESSMGWTLLRNNVYMDMQVNTVQTALALGGKLFSSAGDGRVAYVTREDCARAAAAVLASSFEGRRTLDVTGPEALSQADVARIGSEVTGRDITYVPISRETLIDNMVEGGLPRPAAEMLSTFDAGAEQGLLDEATDTVEDLTGQAPTGLEEFLSEHREELIPEG